jgi:hypothetical protein
MSLHDGKIYARYATMDAAVDAELRGFFSAT